MTNTPEPAQPQYGYVPYTEIEANTPPVPNTYPDYIRQLRALAHLIRRINPHNHILLLASSHTDMFDNPALIATNITDIERQKFLTLNGQTVLGRQLETNIGSRDDGKTWDAWLNLQ